MQIPESIRILKNHTSLEDFKLRGVGLDSQKVSGRIGEYYQ